jgi:hypothetical protein
MSATDRKGPKKVSGESVAMARPKICPAGRKNGQGLFPRKDQQL